ncbi:Hyaluronan mediated motility receptor Intracellular hyaluronic acid-binding protein [Channa argus]|uniref:Hyaluronan mediated motility receptor Intracellular hyaluronic acid-binding protein n=1 Tax=Channa argus TaxID=215402 RepID=A0A6G1PUK7_CHAAH|nr:Hyaluronan mediated motility receptor Intracellular hyaluronic acid-binding protein [Channa argus]
MSFSRAPLKRFNECVGSTPAPGSYEIKPGELRGAASFDKSDRFRPVKAGAGALMPPPSPSRNVLVSPVRRTLSVDGLAEGLSAKKTGMTMERKQQKLLEREIRSLVQQRGEQDRHLLAMEEEMKKVEAKLLAAVREKTGLAANVTTLERQRAELKKINEFLKSKVSSDTTKKRVNSLTMELMEARNTLDVKNKELSVLQINSEGQLKVLETDLQTSRATVTALKERNRDLEELHQVMKIQSEELENENSRLRAVIRELKEEIRVVQEYLDTANDEIQDLRLKLQEKMQDNTVASSKLEEVKQLQTELKQCMTDLGAAQDGLRQKEEEALKFDQELRVSKDALWEAETRLENVELELKSSQNAMMEMEEQMKLAHQDVLDSQATVHQQEAELARLREVLRRTEKELDERVAHLEQRCLYSEEERCKTQEEGLRRVQELKTELNLLKEAKRDEKKRQIQLQQEHAALTEELIKEKALVDSLSVLVKQEREESEEKMRQLTEEMEEVLGELAILEDQDKKRQEMVEKSQEDVQKLQEENSELERQLRDTRTLVERVTGSWELLLAYTELRKMIDGLPVHGIDSGGHCLFLKNNDLATLKDDHLAAMRELQEAHTNSQGKMGFIVTELESTKEALKVAEERQKDLEVEVERVTQQMKDEMDKAVKQKEEEIKRVQERLEEQQERLLAEVKSREEDARILLEVQTRLAQKDEELRAMKMSHAALISQLHHELELQKKEKQEALGQLEEHRGLSFTKLQDEKEKAQKLLEEVSQEREKIMEQLEKERGEKVRIQTAFHELGETLEAERKAHQQLRSEVFRLQAELQRVNEEKKNLLSQVEFGEQSRLALENQLNLAERERNLLQSRLDEVEKEGVSLQTQIDLMEETKQALQQQVEQQIQDRQALEKQVEVLTHEKVTLQWEMEEQRLDLQRKITEAQEKSSPTSEAEHWRQQYDELFAKVSPFQEQLNAFAAERDALLNENGTNQEELNKLADAYARLLGHQNQKQKIKHVVKLKDENISLKQEVTKLRSQVNRQKSDLEQLKSKLPGAARRRFDPSKAFQHNKENRQSETTDALKEAYVKS